MKKILLYISIILAALYSCSNEDLSTPDAPRVEGEVCTLRFSVTISKPSVVSRAFEDEKPSLKSMTLLLFDENGLFVGKQAATEISAATAKDDGTYEGTYKVTLGVTEEKRIIHFVANCTVNDIASLTHENTVLAELNVEDKQDAYWQRMEVNGIGDTTGDNVVDNLLDVRLIRNFVAVKVIEAEGLTTGNDNGAFFIQGYALYNEATSGTVAPYFRNSTGGFPNYSSEIITYTALVDGQKYNGVEPANVSYDNAYPEDLETKTDFTNDEKYTYERSYIDQNAAQNPTFIVLKGLYNNKTYYYRVDIAKDFKWYQLLRNFRYIIQINTICAGYNTIDEAIKGSSFNNLIDVGIKVEEITDGVTTLYVSPTDVTVVNGTENVIIDYECNTNLENVTVNVSEVFDPEVTHDVIDKTNWSTASFADLKGEITVPLLEYFELDDNGKEVVDEVTGRPISTLPGNLQKQSFEVRTSNGLSRRVRINLVDKIEFHPTFSGLNENGNYEYTYELPADLPESMFPLEIYLYEPTGSFTPIVGQGLSVDLIDATTSSNGTWQYKKTLSYEEYLADTDKKFVYEFKAKETLSINNTYTMTVSNEYAYTDGATLAITQFTGDDLTNGELVWYVGGTSTEKTVSISSNIENMTWELGENSLTYFDVTKNDDGTLTIAPKSTENTCEETLVVNLFDGNTIKLTLKVIEKIKEVNVTLNFRYNNKNIDNENVEASWGTLTYSRDGNYTYTLEYKESEENSTNITFSYTTRGGTTYTKTMTIAKFVENYGTSGGRITLTNN